MYYVYFLKSEKDSSVYVGCTWNLEKRVAEHNEGLTKSTKAKRPLTLIYFEEFETQTEALKREKELKRSWFKKQEILRKLKNNIAT